MKKVHSHRLSNLTLSVIFSFSLKKALNSYLSTIRKWVPDDPVIFIDDSDVVKPDGYKFEALGIVRNGSKSTNTKDVYEKGYHVTEACALTKNNHPVSIFSEIHSSKEKNFTSINDVTFSAMERAKVLFGKATFVMDKSIFLLLPVSERYLRHTIVCKRRRQAMVPGKTSGIPSTLP